MSGLEWLDHGPEEWTRRYLASKPPLVAVVTALAFAVMPLFGQRVCPLCGGAHNLSQCPRWRIK